MSFEDFQKSYNKSQGQAKSKDETGKTQWVNTDTFNFAKNRDRSQRVRQVQTEINKAQRERNEYENKQVQTLRSMGVSTESARNMSIEEREARIRKLSPQMARANLQTDKNIKLLSWQRAKEEAKRNYELAKAKYQNQRMAVARLTGDSAKAEAIKRETYEGIAYDVGDRSFSSLFEAEKFAEKQAVIESIDEARARAKELRAKGVTGAKAGFSRKLNSAYVEGDPYVATLEPYEDNRSLLEKGISYTLDNVWRDDIPVSQKMSHTENIDFAGGFVSSFSSSITGGSWNPFAKQVDTIIGYRGQSITPTNFAEGGRFFGVMTAINTQVRAVDNIATNLSARAVQSPVYKTLSSSFDRITQSPIGRSLWQNKYSKTGRRMASNFITSLGDDSIAPYGFKGLLSGQAFSKPVVLTYADKLDDVIQNTEFQRAVQNSVTRVKKDGDIAFIGTRGKGAHSQIKIGNRELEIIRFKGSGIAIDKGDDIVDVRSRVEAIIKVNEQTAPAVKVFGKTILSPVSKTYFAKVPIYVKGYALAQGDDVYSLLATTDKTFKKLDLESGEFLIKTKGKVQDMGLTTSKGGDISKSRTQIGALSDSVKFKGYDRGLIIQVPKEKTINLDPLAGFKGGEIPKELPRVIDMRGPKNVVVDIDKNLIYPTPYKSLADKFRAENPEKIMIKLPSSRSAPKNMMSSSSISSGFGNLIQLGKVKTKAGTDAVVSGVSMAVMKASEIKKGTTLKLSELSNIIKLSSQKSAPQSQKSISALKIVDTPQSKIKLKLIQSSKSSQKTKIGDMSVKLPSTMKAQRQSQTQAQKSSQILKSMQLSKQSQKQKQQQAQISKQVQATIQKQELRNLSLASLKGGLGFNIPSSPISKPPRVPNINAPNDNKGFAKFSKQRQSNPLAFGFRELKFKVPSAKEVFGKIGGLKI